MNRSSLLARTVAVVTTLGAAPTGLAVLAASPAQAALRETNYTFQTSSFGTRVRAQDASLRSGRTAWAFLGCTRMVGRVGKISVAAVDTSENGNALIDIGAVRSRKKTYRNLSNGVRAGVLGTNYVAQVVLGNASLGTPVLTIDGLRSTARSWVDTDGRFHARTGLKLGSIQLAGVDTSGAPQALNDLLGAIQTDLLDNVVAVLGANPGGVEIPGLGRVYLPGDTSSFRKEIVHQKRGTAHASVQAIRVVLYGSDGLEGTADDSDVVIGRASSRISRAPAGAFLGQGYGVSADVANGLVGVGRVAVSPLPCRGTDGTVKQHATAGIDVLNLGMVTTGNVAGYSYGQQHKDGSAVAWTKGEVANVTLSDGGSTTLGITALTGRAHLRQRTNGKLVKAPAALQDVGVKYGDIRGTKIQGVSVNGVDQGDFLPGDSIEVPGLARVVFGEVKPLRRGLQVIAAHVYVLPGAVSDAGLADVKLGVAKVRIKKH